MKWTVLVFCLLVVGCHTSPVTTKKTDNPAVDTETLFTDSDGYTVKRFTDNSHDHYYVVPSGTVIKNGSTGGKYPVHTQETIPTVGK